MKKEWWKMLLRRKEMEVFSRYSPKDGELLSEYIYRMFIPENLILSKNLFILIWNIIAPTDE